VKRAGLSRDWAAPRSAFAGFRFPADVIVVAVRWYLRYGLSYRDVEELLAERQSAQDVVDGAEAFLDPAVTRPRMRGPEPRPYCGSQSLRAPCGAT
jgi:hypothetical protein